MPAILPDAKAACLVDRIGTVRRYASGGKAGRIETFSRSRYAKAVIRVACIVATTARHRPSACARPW
jgi:hypothetical protein